MKRLRKSLFILPILCLFLLLINFSVYAVSDIEKEIAKQNVEKYKEKFGLAELSTKEEKRINNIFDRLTVKAHPDAIDLNFKLYVIDAPVLNAAYMGDGHMMVFKGLLDQVENDNQLAAIIAHEIGHGVNDDIQDSINIIQGIQLGGALVDLITKDSENRDSSNLIANISMILLKKGFDRGQEKEADYYSVFLTKKAGYDPHGTIGVMKLLKRKSGGSSDSELAELFSDHPNLDNRIEYLTALVTEVENAEKLYYSPVATASRLAQGILSSNNSLIYSTYTESIQEAISLERFSTNYQINKVIDKVKLLKTDSNLSYDMKLRNQVDGTARVAINYLSGVEIISLAIDLMKTEYGWRVVREPRLYESR
ncbi:M48 family metallopeptidase [Orenia marismortui]|uniref:M48 family metallopeptidase n=1 Tax=Orenia marismortui TaxID=46469 RepID=UPI000364AF56|nr:M48 family metallopeptidase [Orenia marismortui]